MTSPHRPDVGPAGPGSAEPGRGVATGPTGSPVTARAGAPVRPEERPAGRAMPPHRNPARPEPSGMSPVPSARGGEAPAVARAAAVVAPAGPTGHPGPEPTARRANAPEFVDVDRPEGDQAGDGGQPRRQVPGSPRSRAAVLVLASVLLLGVLPAFFGVQTMNRDPVFASLDQLDVPAWAATEAVDDVTGSPWCLLDCRLRERTTTSDRSPDETAQAYEAALTRDGWQRWTPNYCPEQEEKGSYTCWRRDELTLDLWVRERTCVPPPVDGEPAVVPAPDPATAAQECPGSLVSVKVRNAIDDERTRPQPSTDPSLTGEDPFPTVTDDPLSDLTPSPPS
ncbi:hypothetical protein O3597_14970 [Verrucosispora sp. WMMA2044]|nr:hypothetical protein [Verrucosispora sp. WMMA2044]WBB46505.1 hypothetical protein O3597_14970 [Verrucosispora sp. WMMA2044]